ncbi:MAG: hypothetical protein K2X90_01715 [Candidatus Babeliaceae bacterium]|nr:hypothetical protein [Candidatus Babeliaceae bacterium]
MNYKILSSIFFLWMHSLQAHIIINHAAISAKAHRVQELHKKKQWYYESATKIGAAALCGCILYYLFSSNRHQNDTTVSLKLSAEMMTEIKESPQLIKKALEYYTASRNSWENSTFGSLVKFTGSLVLQSIVLQALQPIYKNVQYYLYQKVSIPVASAWFLAEQFEDSSEGMEHKNIEIEQDFYHFVMHTESLEYAYKNHQEKLIENSAQEILSHIIFVKEYKTFYLYQKHILQRCYDSLISIIQEMACDALNATVDQHKLDAFKDQIRKLRKLPAYSII